MAKKIAAAKFKAQCLQLMDYVKQKYVSLIINKHDKPLAKLVPIEEEPVNLYGALQGTVKVKSGILAPIDEQWDAE